MAKPQVIALGPQFDIPILYEDRGVMAIDKPAGWILAPAEWDTPRNLQVVITASMRGGEYWARARNLKFLRFIHRLDADTTGVLLFAKSAGAIATYSRLFESRQMSKQYFAVVEGVPSDDKWVCDLPLSSNADSSEGARVKVDRHEGKEAKTEFEVLARAQKSALVSARPLTGRTHQIRVHLAESGFPVLGDRYYSSTGQTTIGGSQKEFPMALRAVELSYSDPFTRARVRIRAPSDRFLRAYGFPPQRAGN
jgi:23S rRNA pseudouridine1911/1915/1917 synthase